MSTSDTLLTSPGPTTSRSPQRLTLLATGALLLTTVMWGSTFPLTKELLERVPTLDYLAVRFAIAAAALALVAPRAVLRLSAQSRRRAGLLGLVYALAQMLQVGGLNHTSASVSGFVTGLYVVATPLLAAVLLHTRINRSTWLAVALATVGLAALSLQGFSVGFGEAITLASAVLYGLHIVGLAAWSRSGEALGMSIVQLATISAVCFVGTAPGGVVLPATRTDWTSVLYMALFAGAIGLLAQTWAQAHLPATRSAIIMSLEPVFAATFAIAYGGEHLTARLFVGGSLVLLAMLVVELAPRRRGVADPSADERPDPPDPGAVQHLTI